MTNIMKEETFKIKEVDSSVNQPVITKVENIVGMFETIVATSGVPAAPSTAPKNLKDQIKIYHDDAVWKLYIWDTTGGVWKSVTIT